MATATTDSDDPSTTFGMNIEFSTPNSVLDGVGDGFNEYGVRELEDGSIDVIFAAMEPGLRHEGTPFEVEITPEFLQAVASKQYPDRIPLQFDHSQSQQANVGWVYGQRVKFADGYLKVMAHVPATGSRIREDTIADFTHDPPAISDGSIGLDPRTVEVAGTSKRGEPAEFVDARLQEFSLTPFPAGYDDGGLSPQFAERAGDKELGDRLWDEGDLVEWQATSLMKGLVVTIDSERAVAMVTLHTEEDGVLVNANETVTAGFDDLILYTGDAEPATSDGSGFSGSQLVTVTSQLRTI